VFLGEKLHEKPPEGYDQRTEGSFMARHKTLVTYLTAYLVATGTAIRDLSAYRGESYQREVLALLAAFFLLLAIEPRLTRRSRRYTHLYLAVQAGIIFALSLIPPRLDFFSLLFIPLILQAVYVFHPQIAFRWTIAFTVIMAVLMFSGQGWSRGLPLVVIMVILYLFFGSYAAVVRRAEAALEVSQKLLAELRATHEELQLYTEQAEELAVVQERNRLARNLHDAVTQTIFSMTLTAEAAHILFDRDPPRAGTQLDKLQELAQSALGEMRSLVFELRPTAVAELGLIPALRHHITALERQHGLIVALHTAGKPHLSDTQAQRLFRIIQEALNNVVKHARTDRASVTLQNESDHVLVQVEDHGCGFTPETTDSDGGHMGLITMRDRAEMMGGTVTINSRPGEGTRVTVEITLSSGDEKNG
jgi:signal transduction histidine kinase